MQSALDEAGETMAFLEDMSLRRAVDRLELLGDDLARLAGILPATGLDSSEARPKSPSDFPDEISLALEGAIPAIPQVDADHAEIRSSSDESAERTAAHDDAAVKRLRKQAQARRAARAARSSASGRKNCWPFAWRNSSAGGSSRFSKTRCSS